MPPEAENELAKYLFAGGLGVVPSPGGSPSPPHTCPSAKAKEKASLIAGF